MSRLRLRPGRGRSNLPSRLRGVNPFYAGLATLIVLAIGVFFIYTKRVPFTHGFRFRAVFASALDVRPKSPVRIAGVPVGTVTGISRYPGSNAAVVSFDLDKQGLPLHSDATLAIRPRIFLEGNFFVDLSPGTPTAPTLRAGATIPITQTSDPVQLDQVLSALNGDTRTSLQDLLAGYGQALTHVPTAAENATRDASTRGLTGAQGLNQAYRRSPAALRDSTIVGQALLGQRNGDLERLIAGLDKLSRGLDTNQADLQSLVTNFDTTLGSFAAESRPLADSLTVLPQTLANARDALARLNTALPATRSFARALIPAVQQTPATITAALPWIAQARALLGGNELGGLAPPLGQLAQSLGSLSAGQTSFQGQLDAASRCTANVLIPTGNVVLNDRALSSGTKNYLELLSALVGLSGESANFDGNGSYIRFLVSGGGPALATGPATIVGSHQQGDRLFARAPLPPLGTSPRYLGAEPPYKPNVACAGQQLPDLNGPLAHGPADGSTPGQPTTGGTP